MLEENVIIEGIIEKLILYYNSGFVPFTKERWEILRSKKLTSKTITEIRIYANDKGKFEIPVNLEWCKIQ